MKKTFFNTSVLEQDKREFQDFCDKTGRIRWSVFHAIWTHYKKTEEYQREIGKVSEVSEVA